MELEPLKKATLLFLLVLCLCCVSPVYADDTSDMVELLVPLMFLLIAVGIIICMLVTVILLVVVVTKT